MCLYFPPRRAEIAFTSLYKCSRKAVSAFNDEDGLLMVKREDGRIEKVIAGDVSIRPAQAKQGEYA